MSKSPKEPRYRLSLTYEQLSVLKNQMEAAAEPAHRCAVEESLLDLIFDVHQRAFASRKAKAPCVQPHNEMGTVPHHESTKLVDTVVLETKDARGKELWISCDNGTPVLFCLDCNFHSMGGRDYGELPRFYRTERGARQAAALLTGDKLVWKTPDPAS